jgi:hypothetical protein
MTCLGVNLHFIKVSTENDNNFGYEKITILVDNIPLSDCQITSCLKSSYPGHLLHALFTKYGKEYKFFFKFG